jgi:hypothetical protein
MFENTLVILAVLVLLPLIPAFILFKLLPAGAEVDGLMAGLKVKLGGAFGGYIALTVFLATFYANSLKPDPSAIETWTVIGEVAHTPGYEAITCKLSPALAIEPGDNFEWQIPVVKGSKLPHVAFQAAGYEPETLWLSETDHINKRFPIDVDAAKHIVRVKTPITLHKKEMVAATPSSLGSMTSGGL